MEVVLMVLGTVPAASLLAVSGAGSGAVSGAVSEVYRYWPSGSPQYPARGWHSSSIRATPAPPLPPPPSDLETRLELLQSQLHR